MSRLKSVTIKFVSYIISALNDIYVFWAAEICDFFQRHFPVRRRSLWIPTEPHYPAPFVSLFYEAHCAASIMGLTPASACPALCPSPCVSPSAPQPLRGHGHHDTAPLFTNARLSTPTQARPLCGRHCYSSMPPTSSSTFIEHGGGDMLRPSRHHEARIHVAFFAPKENDVSVRIASRGLKGLE